MTRPTFEYPVVTVLGKTRRQRVTVEARRLNGWTKPQTRAFYDRLVHHDKLKVGRAVVAALGMAGR